jgi:hypothetical protein
LWKSVNVLRFEAACPFVRTKTYSPLSLLPFLLNSKANDFPNKTLSLKWQQDSTGHQCAPSRRFYKHVALSIDPMKVHLPVLLAIAVTIASGPTVAFERPETNGHDLANPFREPLLRPAFGNRVVRQGIPTSPFAIDHPVEQMVYDGLYAMHYNANMTEERELDQSKLPSATDADGHPLWYDGWRQSEFLKTIIGWLYVHNQYDDLDRLFDDWNDSRERLADGRWKLVMFHNAMVGTFRSDWQQALDDVRHWREAKPQSRAAILTEALYWLQYAWLARGGGPANSVTPEAWSLFKERLLKADTLLRQTKPLTGSSPLWGRISLEVALGLDVPRQQMLETFMEVSKDGPVYTPHYTAMANALSPRWGGSWEWVDQFVRAAVTRTAGTEGYSLYARIYWTVREQHPDTFELFRDSRANWPDMKRGFDDLMRAYPHSAAVVNEFAATACMANDKESFRALRLKLGKAITRESWPTNHSLDLCDHSLGAEPL